MKLEEKRENKNLALLAIVAIVAIVSIVVIFNQKSVIFVPISQTPSVSEAQDPSQALAGQGDYGLEEESLVGEAVADIIGAARTYSIKGLIELNPRERHELKPAEESIVNFFVRSVQTLPDNKKQVEWCVATTSDQPPQAYHIRMYSLNPFTGPPYSIPEDKLETDEIATLKLSSDKKTVSADFTTYDGKDGFCAKTTEPATATISKSVKLDVWTNVSKVRVGRETHSLWVEYNVLMGNEALPRCEATSAAKVYRCTFNAVAVKLEAGAGLVDAQFVTASGIPTTMRVGQTAQVSITMKNTGQSTWTKTGTNPYELLSLDKNWGVARVQLPVDTVAKEQEVSFPITIKAPAATGTYKFKWQMSQRYVQKFGDIAPQPPVSIPVMGAIIMTPSQTKILRGGTLQVKWDNVGTAYPNDWITIMKPESPDNGWDGEPWFYVKEYSSPPHLSGTGTLSAPPTAGDYELRYYENDGFTLKARGPIVTVT